MGLAQVFISYSRSEKQAASLLAQRLTEAGYDVWWDAEILGGTRFEDEISNVLRTAPVAVILWSKSAAASDWVRAEAEIARHLKSALPIIIDDVDIAALPILFQQIHVIELRNWDGSTNSAGYQQVLKALSDRLATASAPGGGSARPASRPASPPSPATLAEADAWAELMKLPNPVADDYRDFLEHYPGGQFAAVAQMRLKRLKRRAGRFWRFAGLITAAVVVLGVIGGLSLTSVRDRLFSLLPHDPAACPIEGVKTLTALGKIKVCADDRIWQPFTVGGAMPGTLYFASTGGASVQITPMAQAMPVNVAKQYFVRVADPTAAVNVTGEATEIVSGVAWTVWHWTSTVGTSTVNYITYYYTSPSLGSIVLTFFGYGGDEVLKVFGDPMMQSVTFS
jgi:TIR domain